MLYVTVQYVFVLLFTFCGLCLFYDYSYVRPALRGTRFADMGKISAMGVTGNTNTTTATTSSVMNAK